MPRKTSYDASKGGVRNISSTAFSAIFLLDYSPGVELGFISETILYKYFKDVSSEFNEFRVNIFFIFANCVVGTCNILCGRVFP